MESEPHHLRLERVTGLVALATILLTSVHVIVGRVYRGHRRGHAISLLPSVLPTFLTALLLFLGVVALVVLYIHRLFWRSHDRSATNDQLLIVLAGIAALFWTGFIGTERRRRVVAVKLASIPCFGNGTHAANHQLMPHGKSTMLASSPLYVAPIPISSPVRSMSSITTLTVTEHSSSPLSTPDRQADRRRSSTVGITRRKVWEFSCRTASTWIYGRAKRQAWPLNVVRTYRTKGKRFILIKDETIQDGAGAALLEPAFTHSRDLDKTIIARTVYEALNRGTLCVLHSWNKRFEGKLFQRFSQLPAVVNMLTGEIRQSIDKEMQPSNDTSSDGQDRCYLTELLWAVIVVEILDYLQYKRGDLPVLSWLVDLPKWLCVYDAARIESEIETVFETWKAGRYCGKSLRQPCDSECCCHHAVCRTGCGCQCPCVCSCA